MIEYTLSQKKIITQHWLEVFPQLSEFSKNKFYKVVGPLIAGIELINIQRIEGYRPYFVMYQLWGNIMGKDIKSCLEGPTILLPFRDEKGFQIDIPYNKHHEIFYTVLKSIKKEMPISLNGDVCVRDLFQFIDRCISSNITATNIIIKLSLIRFKFDLALYVRNIEQANFILDGLKKQIALNEKNLSKFPQNSIKFLTMNIENLNSTYQDMISIVKENMNAKKISKLTFSDLVK